MVWSLGKIGKNISAKTVWRRRNFGLNRARLMANYLIHSHLNQQRYRPFTASTWRHLGGWNRYAYRQIFGTCDPLTLVGA
jgi:hypothetical protein